MKKYLFVALLLISIGCTRKNPDFLDPIFGFSANAGTSKGSTISLGGKLWTVAGILPIQVGEAKFYRTAKENDRVIDEISTANRIYYCVIGIGSETIAGTLVSGSILERYFIDKSRLASH